MKTQNTTKPAPFTFTRLLSPVTALALFAASGGSVLADLTAPESKKPIGTIVPASGGVLADEAPKRLQAGNAHFVDDISTQTNKHAKRRAEVAEKQKPFAIVVSCSDSRVGPEVVFDQGLGDLFVVRTAGHVVDDVGLGSIEYAVEHLGASLILVLGHERCGAVAATVAGGKAHGHLPAIVKAIQPAVAKTKGQPGDAVDNAVRANVREVAAQLKAAGPVPGGARHGRHAQDRGGALRPGYRARGDHRMTSTGQTAPSNRVREHTDEHPIPISRETRTCRVTPQ